MSRKRRPRTIHPALERAIKAAEWLEATDEGVQRASLRLADDLDRIDSLLRDLDDGKLFGDPKVVGDLIGKRAYLAQSFLAYLKQMRLTPETREGISDEQGGALEFLRSLVDSPEGLPGALDGGARGAPGDPDSPDPDAAGSGTVS